MRRLLILLLFCVSNSFSQTSTGSIHLVSKYEKRWAITHPFNARHAFELTRHVLHLVDSLKHAGTIGTDLNGGALDAFKHSYWMALLSSEIGSKKALKLGRAHERGNYLQFKNGTAEDGSLPDSVASAMDLFNNAAGAGLVISKKEIPEQELITKVMNALHTGQLKMIRKDEKGHYLDCEGRLLDLKTYGHQWALPKCLVRSKTN